MNMTPDPELLRDYTRTKSEEAFAELVRRHVNLVYSAALRQVGGDAHHAQDVAQTVFTELARKAASLSRRESLTGWLYTSAHFAASKVTRTESRRRDRKDNTAHDQGAQGSEAHDTSAAGGNAEERCDETHRAANFADVNFRETDVVIERIGHRTHDEIRQLI